jgi:hypothetical protein
MSTIARSKPFSARDARPSASSPSDAPSTATGSMPRASIARASAFRLARLSSTTSARRPTSLARAGSGSAS